VEKKSEEEGDERLNQSTIKIVASIRSSTVCGENERRPAKEGRETRSSKTVARQQKKYSHRAMGLREEQYKEKAKDKRRGERGKSH